MPFEALKRQVELIFEFIILYRLNILSDHACYATLVYHTTYFDNFSE